jgi:hypothetical protein
MLSTVLAGTRSTAAHAPQGLSDDDEIQTISVKMSDSMVNMSVGERSTHLRDRSNRASTPVDDDERALQPSGKRGRGAASASMFAHVEVHLFETARTLQHAVALQDHAVLADRKCPPVRR